MEPYVFSNAASFLRLATVLYATRFLFKALHTMESPSLDLEFSQATRLVTSLGILPLQGFLLLSVSEVLLISLIPSCALSLKSQADFCVGASGFFP
jgi:hypothetical protein